MKRKDLLLGSALIFLGIGFFGDTLGTWRLDWFLESWWVLFILVPCLGSMKENGLERGNMIGFSVGVSLLLVVWFPAFQPYFVSYLLTAIGLIIFLVPADEC